MRWHCLPDTEFEIRVLAVWGRTRYTRSRRLSTILNLYEWTGKSHFCSFETWGPEWGSTFQAGSFNHCTRPPLTETYVKKNLFFIVIRKYFSSLRVDGKLTEFMKAQWDSLKWAGHQHLMEDPTYSLAAAAMLKPHKMDAVYLLLSRSIESSPLPLISSKFINVPAI